MGDRVRLVTALCDLGAIHAQRNPPKEAFPYLQRSLALFEDAGEKRGQEPDLYSRHHEPQL